MFLLQLLCPVCREEISYSEESFPETPVEEKVIFIPSEDMIKQQAKMAAMLEKQRQCGGLIDVEAEKNKFLISTDVSDVFQATYLAITQS